MYKKILKEIKKYDDIVIARHVGIDPDAMASQIALRDSIRLTFPKKNVKAVGTGSAKFKYIGDLDKFETGDNTLLIVVDTPDKKRIDIPTLEGFKQIIKIDHHPFVDEFSKIEYIEPTASSAAEIIMEFIKNTKLECNEAIARTLFIGVASDSNRFLFNTCTPKTFDLVSYYIDKYNLNINEIYQVMYRRPLKEVRLEGYISTNLKVTDNAVAYIEITDDIITKYNVDSASAGNMVNNYNFIEEVLVWLTITEDVKNGYIRVSIRSRGPVINTVAEKYNGGGHQFASGAKVSSFEEAHLLVSDLDRVTKKYIEDNNLSKEG